MGLGSSGLYAPQNPGLLQEKVSCYTCNDEEEDCIEAACTYALVLRRDMESVDSRDPRQVPEVETPYIPGMNP